MTKFNFYFANTDKKFRFTPHKIRSLFVDDFKDPHRQLESRTQLELWMIRSTIEKFLVGSP